MIDIEGLVAAKLLDLDAVFARARWQVVDRITTYTACVYGSQGDEPGEVQVSLESATEYDIVAYRWAASDDGGVCEHGPIVLDEDEARDAGEEYAQENDEEPDANLTVRNLSSGAAGKEHAGQQQCRCAQHPVSRRTVLVLVHHAMFDRECDIARIRGTASSQRGEST